MRFGILGSLEIRSGGAEVRLGAPKLRALVLALLLDAGRVVPAERLVDDLWGDEATPQALVSLRSYVSNLRRLLAVPDRPSVIQTRGPGYLLDLDPAQIDAVQFERAVARGRALLADGRPDEARIVLDEGLALWRGPALADVADLAFARASALRLEELRLAAREDRLDALLQAGRHTDVVGEAEALAAEHPLRERARAQLMLALYRSGRAPEALGVHRAFRQELADEAGLDPSAQLEALASAMLRRDPKLEAVVVSGSSPGAPTRGEHPSADPGHAPGTEPVPDVRGGLVGRAAEQRHLLDAVAGLASGRGGIVLLAGEPGIGKTALLRELRAGAEAAAVPVAWGRCHETQSAPAFWPWVQLLRSLTESLDDAELQRCLAGAAGAVVHLVPELAPPDHVGPPADPVDPQAARFALYHAVVTFLRRVAAGHGLVVVIDDLHWGDAASLELAAYLGATASTHGILLAGSYRETPAERTTELDAALSDLAREEGSSTLRLSGLSPREVGHLVARVAGTEVDPAVADLLHERAGGNPFFVHQLAKLQAEADDPVGPAAIPVGVRQVLHQRLQPLPDDIRRTLEAASVLGQDFDARPLGRCCGLALPEILDHLDVAAAHGLVEGTSGATRWRFVHALIRDAVREQLRPSRVVRLHVAAADALECEQPPPVQQIAEHLWLAADLVEPGRPIEWLRAAAEQALAVYAYEQGERHLRQVLHLLAHRPEMSPAVELEVRLRLVQVLVGLHGWSAAGIAEVTSRARELAGEVGVGPGLTSLWWSRWALSMTRGDLDEALSLSTQLLADVTELGTAAEQFAGHVAVAYTQLFHPGDVPSALQHLAAAARAEAAADPERLPVTPERLPVARRITLALAEMFQGDERAALAAAADAVATAQSIGTPFSEAYARMFGGFVASALDLPDEAASFTGPGMELCTSMGLQHLGNLTVPAHAWACAHNGGSAQEQCRRIEAAIDGLTAVGHRHALAYWWTLLAEVRVLAGDASGAGEALHTARALAEDVGEPVYGTSMARVEQRIAGASARHRANGTPARRGVVAVRPGPGSPEAGTEPRA